MEYPLRNAWGYTYIYWLVVYPSEKYEFVTWDDDIPNMMGKS